MQGRSCISSLSAELESLTYPIKGGSRVGLSCPRSEPSTGHHVGTVQYRGVVKQRPD